VFRTIVVPLDDSVESRRAIAPAVLVGRSLAAPIQLVSVISPGIDPLEATIALEETAAGVDAPMRPHAVLFGNDVAAALGDHLRGCESPLVCMATHGRRALASVVLGSTAQAILARVTAPVLLVGPDATPSAEQVDIAVAVDPDSQTSAASVQLACEWARAVGGRVHLVGAVRRSEVRVIGDEPARAGLGELARRCREAGVPATWRVASSSDDVADAVLDAVAEIPATMIVLGTRARRPAARALLGSVAQQLVRRARCPVLAIPVHVPSHDSAAAPAR
jgi:nucleotide-binding universal stress UspA family protein